MTHTITYSYLVTNPSALPMCGTFLNVRTIQLIKPDV